MIDIHFENPGVELQTSGYYIRLESISDKQGAYGNGPGGIGGVNKVNKMMKQGAFQFSYDPVQMRFTRELRDKDNKDIMVDKSFLQLKVLKDQWIKRI